MPTATANPACGGMEFPARASYGLQATLSDSG